MNGCVVELTGAGRVALHWLQRPQRVLLGVAVLWVFSAADLSLTLTERSRTFFTELNPLAAMLLTLSPEAVIVFKTALVMIGSAILLSNRMHVCAEYGCWLLVSVAGAVGLRWWMYYQHVMATFNDPAVWNGPMIALAGH